MAVTQPSLSPSSPRPVCLSRRTSEEKKHQLVFLPSPTFPIFQNPTLAPGPYPRSGPLRIPPPKSEETHNGSSTAIDKS